MSVQLDNLIAILRDSSENPEFADDMCSAVNCGSVSCSKCPFDSSAALNVLVEELEVLQHAKA